MKQALKKGVAQLMSGGEIFGIFMGVLSAMSVIHKISGAKTPVRASIISMLSGVLALTAVNLCSGFTNIFIPVSMLSLGVSAFLGISGVTLLLVLQMIL